MCIYNNYVPRHFPKSHNFPFAHAGLSPQMHTPSLQLSEDRKHSSSLVHSKRLLNFSNYMLV